MPPPPLIVDTNVVVSGLLTRSATSPNVLIVELMLTGELPFLLSEELLAEYVTVLHRPAISLRLGLNEESIDLLLLGITENALFADAPPIPELAPDHGDQHLWSLLAARPDAVLVTADRLLLETEAWPGRVQTAAIAVERFVR